MPKRSVNLAKRLQGKRVCVCVGAGGVGKTTTSAALAFGLAARGAKVAEVTTESANAAVKRRISPAYLLVVVVGTAAEISAQVETAIGPLVDVKVVPFDSDDGVAATDVIEANGAGTKK